MHPFDDAMALERRSDGVQVGRTTPAYWNFAGPFGGVSAAILLRAALDDPARNGTPVALTVNFCAPVAEGEFELVPSLVRGGRRTQHWRVEQRQGGEVRTSASVLFAQRAHTWSHQPAVMPVVPPPEAVEPMGDQGWTAWIANYDFRFVEGGLVMGGPAQETLHPARSLVWLEDQPPRPLDWLSLAALADAFFPRVMHARGLRRTRLGTVTLTTYFHVDADELAALGAAPVLGVADGERFSHGFQDQRVQLWGRGGNLLVSGSQMLWYEQ